MLFTLILTSVIFIQENSFLNSIVETDQSFSLSAEKSGYVLAFQQFILSDAVLFDPGPTDLKTWSQKRKEELGSLSWTPTFSGGALSGDLGYTSGPWIYHAANGEEVFGHYVTIWKEQFSGAFKVILDIGVSHQKPKDTSLSGTAVKSCHVAGVADEETDFETEKENLFKADQAFSKRLVNRGFVDAFEMCSDFELKSFRKGHLPIHGQLDLLQCFKEGKLGHVEQEGWDVLGFDLAESREFGYTFGQMKYVDPKQGGETYYLRIWKKSYDGAWLVALEVIQ